ncbi:MAG: type II secretion system protein N [Candidatus Binatia bacterium]
MQPRTVLGLTLLLLGVVAISGFWLWNRLVRTALLPSPVVATATMAPVRRVTAGATAAGTPPPRSPAGYRLAGVAVGEPESFAVVEAPNGATALYRLNDEVAGLGQLIRIDAERVVVRSEAGQFELWLSPAATTTPTVPRPAKPTPTARPQPRPQTGGRAAGPKS